MKRIVLMALVTIVLFLAAPLSSDAGRSHSYSSKGVKPAIMVEEAIMGGGTVIVPIEAIVPIGAHVPPGISGSIGEVR